MNVKPHSCPFGEFILDCRHLPNFLLRIGDTHLIIHVIHSLNFDSNYCVPPTFVFDPFRDRFFYDREREGADCVALGHPLVIVIVIVSDT